MNVHHCFSLEILCLLIQKCHECNVKFCVKKMAKFKPYCAIFSALPVDSEDCSIHVLDFDDIMVKKARYLFEWRKSMGEDDIQREIYDALRYLKACLKNRKLVICVSVLGVEDRGWEDDGSVCVCVSVNNRFCVRSICGWLTFQLRNYQLLFKFCPCGMTFLI